MQLSPGQKQLIERVVNVFETGSPDGNYSAIVIYNDGPGGIRQITYGRSQTTEYSNLKALIQMYISANGAFSTQLQQYAGEIGVTPLTDNANFKQLLEQAGKQDPVMKNTQDDFFDKAYFQPAMGWATTNGFTLPLSGLVIYDSYIHSGGIKSSIRNMFPESPPANGGDEKAWTTAYVNARQSWLSNNPNPIVKKTIYRTQTFKNQIAVNNWNLDIVPISANGVNVSPSQTPTEAA